MTKTSRILTLLLMISLTNLFIVTPAMALIPPLPSSFYGTVKVNGENVADGTVVRALINGQVYATGYTQTYQGGSVYSLDVPGDDSSSTAIEGGRDGDTVQFEIAGVLAGETGTWKSATNVNVNLTASVAAPLNTPQPTPTPVPTQTAIKPPKKSPTSTTAVESNPTESVSFPSLTPEPAPTSTLSESQVLSQPTKSVAQPPGNPTTIPQIPSTPAQLVDPEENSPGDNILLIVLVIILAVIIFWAFRVIRKPNSSKER